MHDLEVIGTIPRELDGAYYRNSADHAHPPLFESDTATSHVVGMRHRS